MKNVFVKISIAVIIFLSMCGYAENASQIKQRLGESVFSTLKSPNKVTAEEISGVYFGVIAHKYTKITLTNAEVEKLKSILLSDKSFNFNSNKNRIFAPTLAFEFTGNKKVSIVISKMSQEINIQHGDINFTIDYDPVAKELNKFYHIMMNEIEKTDPTNDLVNLINELFYE